MLYAQRNSPLRFPPGKEISTGVRELSEEEALYLLGAGSGGSSRAEQLAFEYTGVFMPELRAISVGAASAVLRAASGALIKLWEEKTVVEVLTAPDAAMLAHVSCEHWLSKPAPDCKPAVLEDQTHTRATWDLEVSYGDGGSVVQFVAHKEGNAWVVAQIRERMHWSGGE